MAFEACTLWDFLGKYPSMICEGKFGIYSFYVPDPYTLNFLFRRLPNSGPGTPFHRLFGKEITADWVEENWNAPSLFGSESFIIMDAETMPENAYARVLPEPCGERHLIFIFTKEARAQKQFASIKGTHICIKEPPFWEMPRLLQVFAREMKLTLEEGVAELLVERTPAAAEDYFLALTQAGAFADSKGVVTLESARSAIADRKHNFFESAQLFCDRYFDRFFSEAVSMGYAYEQHRALYSFMQGHLLRVIQMRGKADSDRSSSYDRKLIKTSFLWRDEELSVAMRRFGELEILAKKKDPFLLEEVKTAFLKSKSK